LIDGTAQQHLEGKYFIEWREDGARRRRSVGTIPSAILAEAQRQRSLLDAMAAGIEVAKSEFAPAARQLLVADAAARYLRDVQMTSKQSDLLAALEQVVGRLLTQYKDAQARWRTAQAQKDGKAAEEAKDEMDSLILFKQDMGSFQRVYTFLSQIFDYQNTAIEARPIFYRRLLPLLDFGCEREEIDLSKVKLTHHNLKSKGKQAMVLGEGDTPKLPPITDVGSGSVQEKEKALLAEIIAKVNDLFEGELTEDDKLVYVNNVIKGKLLESDVRVQRASNNTKEQFSNSPDMANGILNAIMDALAAHSTMIRQALDSEKVRSGLKDVLLGPAQLYEALRARGDVAQMEVHK
jgi:type I restriction enzyme R subunit